ncbi:MAG: DsbC family protein [Cellvibrionaceae bacterium]|nr:DsbC family protein [Cellvibrionaceae bacterium]
MIKSILYSVVSVLMSASLYAGPAGLPTIERIVTLPVNKIQAVDSGEQIFFISENGRYVFRGQLTDTWHKKTLDTIGEIDYAAKHIDLDVMGLPLDQMNTISIPGGPERVTVFVDPVCPFCKAFIEDALTKTQDYNFKIIVVPAFGGDSNRMAKSLFCAKDKSQALTMYMQQTLDTMAQQPHCNTDNYDLTLMVAQLFGIQEIPFFITPDGRYKAGAEKGFWAWVKNKG